MDTQHTNLKALAKRKRDIAAIILTKLSIPAKISAAECQSNTNRTFLIFFKKNVKVSCDTG